MLFNHYEVEQIMKQRVQDALREAEQIRLARLVQGPSRSRRWRRSVALILKGLLATFTGHRAAEPRCLSLPVAPDPTCKGCPGS
jgi:hypothetical protein